MKNLLPVNSRVKLLYLSRPRKDRERGMSEMLLNCYIHFIEIKCDVKPTHLYFLRLQK